MTSSSTNNVLQNYLTTVNSNQVKNKTKKSKPSTVVQKKIASHNESSLDTENRVFEKIFTTAKRLDDVISHLSKGQLNLIEKIFLESKASYIPYIELVQVLCEKLQRNALAIKNELSVLVELNIVLLLEHHWQGKLIKINPFIFSKIEHAKKSTINIDGTINLPYAHCELLYSATLLPFEKQLLFFMYELQAIIQTSNRLLSKAQVTELRTKFIAINGMLTVLEHPVFQCSTPDTEEKFISDCEDSVVRFILYMAKELRFIKFDHQFIAWNETIWLNWLGYTTEEQVYILRIIMSQYFVQYMQRSDYYHLITILYPAQDWTQSSLGLVSSEFPLIQLIYACGWIDVVQFKGEIYTKQKEKLMSKVSLPVVLPTLQLMCLPDCDSLAIWKLLPAINYNFSTEIINLDLTVKSIMNALKSGYSEQQLEQLINIEHHATQQAHFVRLVLLAKQQMTKHITDRNAVRHEVSLLRTRSTHIDKLVLQCTIQLLFIKQDIEAIESRLSRFSSRWMSALHDYNLSTKKTMVEEAIENGISLEIETELKRSKNITKIIPTCIKRNVDDYIIDYIADADVKFQIDNQQGSFLLSSVTRLRLCR